MHNKELIIRNWGLVEYKKALQEQEVLFEMINYIKQTNRLCLSDQVQATPNYIISCEHLPVYTLGTMADKRHLLVNENYLQQAGIAKVNTNRGGAITYHGPGQLIVYLVIDLENFCKDIHAYLRLLEQAVIDTLADFGVLACTRPALTGVWIFSQGEYAKICAIGVRLSKWITMHGLALNVTTDLLYFNHIIPCGIENCQTISLEHILKNKISMVTVEEHLLRHLCRLLKAWK